MRSQAARRLRGFGDLAAEDIEQVELRSKLFAEPAQEALHAPGIDRIVDQLAGEDDIRKVFAFPKTKNASDPMTGATSPVTEKQLRTLHISVVEESEAK